MIAEQTPTERFIQEAREVLNEAHSIVSHQGSFEDIMKLTPMIDGLTDKLIALPQTLSVDTKHLDLSLILKEREIYMRESSKLRDEHWKLSNEIYNLKNEIAFLKEGQSK